MGASLVNFCKNYYDANYGENQKFKKLLASKYGITPSDYILKGVFEAAHEMISLEELEGELRPSSPSLKTQEKKRIVEAIESFEPIRKYQNEETYHMELARFLREKFPNVRIEESRGSSRPDIVIGDIAIEIKGPTYDVDIQTIPDKCMRYLQHYRDMIVVLYDVHVSDGRYNEWLEGMQNKFPEVIVIKK